MRVDNWHIGGLNLVPPVEGSGLSLGYDVLKTEKIKRNC